MHGLRDPSNYHGLRDGADDDGGGADATLAEIYAAGLAGDPTTDNLMVGSYYGYYFDTDGSVKQTQTASDNGVGAQDHAGHTTTRAFTVPGIVGVMNRYRVKSDFVGGLNTLGGMYDEFALISAAGAVSTILSEYTTALAGPNASYMSPTYTGGGQLTTRRLEMIGRGGTNNNFHDWNSDGAYWSNPRVPAGTPTIAGAIIHSLSGINPSVVPDGSGLEWTVRGPGDIGSGAVMGRLRWVLDDSNFGSEQCETHAEVWVSTLAGGNAIGLEVWPTHTDVAGDLIVADDVACGDIMCGAINAATDIAALGTVSSSSFPAGVAGTPGTIESAVVSLLATSTNNALAPVFPTAGRYFVVTAARWIVVALDGTITTPATMNAGNDVAKINACASAQGITGANITAILASGLPAPVPHAPGINNSNRQMVDAGTSFKFDVTVAAIPATATVFDVKLQLSGWWATA